MVAPKVGPYNPPIETRFTSANARENGRKGGLAFWARNKEKFALKRDLTPVEREARALMFKMVRLRVMMTRSRTPADLRDLATAYSRLLSAWQVLTGTPNPGMRRPGREKPVATIDLPDLPSAPQSVVVRSIWVSSNIPL